MDSVTEQSLVETDSFCISFLGGRKKAIKESEHAQAAKWVQLSPKVVTKEFRGALYKCREISFFPQPKKRTFMWFKTHSGMSSIGPDHLIMSQQKNSVSFLTICSSSLFQRWIGVSSQIPPASSCASWFVWLHTRSTRATESCGQWRSSLRGAVRQFAHLLVEQIGPDAGTWKDGSDGGLLPWCG